MLISAALMLKMLHKGEAFKNETIGASIALGASWGALLLTLLLHLLS